MRTWGQAPRFQFGETPSDILAMLRAGQSAGAGAGDGGNAGDGQGSGGSDGAGAGGSGGSGDGDKGKDGTPFDAARAQRTIDALREEVKAGKAHKTQLDDALARLQAIEDKDKSDGEKAVSQLTRTQAELKAAQLESESLKAKYNGAIIGGAIERAASAANAIDIDTVAALVDRSAITIEEDGAVKGADKAVADLLKAKPFLVKSDKPGVQNIPGTPSGGKGGASSREDLIAENRKKLQATGQYGRVG